MRQFYEQYVDKRWYVVSLVGITLSGAMMLNPGQARILKPPTPIPTVAGYHALSRTLIVTKPLAEDSQHAPSSHTMPHSPSPSRQIQNEVISPKKRLGLAMLFLGVLAEKR